MMFVIIGIVAGLIGGMGIGGGTILIPALVFFAHISQKAAQGINLVTFLPVSIVALIVHTKEGRVRYGAALFITIFAIAGAIIGARLAAVISAFYLRKLFGVFLLVMGLYEFLRREK